MSDRRGTKIIIWRSGTGAILAQVVDGAGVGREEVFTAAEHGSDRLALKLARAQASAWVEQYGCPIDDRVDGSKR